MSTTADSPLRIDEVVPGVHVIETTFWGKPLCLYLFRGERTLLCDTGVAGMPGELYLPALEKMGLLEKGIDLILNAHSHIDHFGGNGEVRARFPRAVILSHVVEMPYIADHGAAYDAIYERWPELFQFGDDFREENMRLTGEVAGPDLGLVGGERIDLGGISLEVLSLACHAFGDLGLYDAERRLMFSGEALLAKGARDAAGNVVAPPYYENAENYDAALRRLEGLEIDVLCTSHFGVLRGQEIRGHLRESREFFDDYERDVLATVNDAPREGLTALETARAFAEKYSPFEFRLETMQLVSTHLQYLAKKGLVQSAKGRFRARR